MTLNAPPRPGRVPADPRLLTHTDGWVGAAFTGLFTFTVLVIVTLPMVAILTLIYFVGIVMAAVLWPIALVVSAVATFGVVGPIAAALLPRMATRGATTTRLAWAFIGLSAVSFGVTAAVLLPAAQLLWHALYPETQVMDASGIVWLVTSTAVFAAAGAAIAWPIVIRRLRQRARRSAR